MHTCPELLGVFLGEIKMRKQIKITEVYLQQEYFNHRLNCTIPAAWIAVFNNGHEVAICREWEASTAEDAQAYYEMHHVEFA
jgi:hypothetical protein